MFTAAATVFERSTSRTRELKEAARGGQARLWGIRILLRPSWWLRRSLWMKGRKVNGKVTHLESFALASNVVAELAKLEEELEVIGFPFLMAGGKVAESPIRFVLKSLSWEPPPPHPEDLGPMEGLTRKRKRTI